MIELSSSKLARVMNCAGSLAFKDLEDVQDKTKADEGTAAGELLAHKILGTEYGDFASNGYAFDREMHFHTDVVAKNILERAQGNPVSCEQKIDWTTLNGVAKIKGRYDIKFMVGKELHIIDFKYGYRSVEHVNNWQLIAYAIGERKQCETGISTFHLTIEQPRSYHEDSPSRTWTIDGDTLTEFQVQIEERALAIHNGEKGLVTGPWCRYCKAAPAACSALNKACYAAIDYSHEFVEDNLDNDQVKYQLELAERAEDILKIKKQSLEDLLISRMKDGQVVTGYKMTESYGNRKWLPTANPDLIKMMTGKDVTEVKMLSPSQCERIGVPKDLVKKLVERPYKGMKLKRTEEDGESIFGS